MKLKGIEGGILWNKISNILATRKECVERTNHHLTNHYPNTKLYYKGLMYIHMNIY